MYTDSGSHTVRISTPGDGKYIDIDAIKIVALTDLVKPAAISDPSATTGTDDRLGEPELDSRGR